jgi:hypothetical protein
VASINVGVLSKYNNKERVINLNSKALCVKLKVVFKKGIYAKRGLFMPG